MINKQERFNNVENEMEMEKKKLLQGVISKLRHVLANDRKSKKQLKDVEEEDICRERSAN